MVRMLRHPSSLNGARRVADEWGVTGTVLWHPGSPPRSWTVHSLFRPVNSVGLRARLVDDKGFITFINQMELEMLLGTASQGSWCSWAGRPYPAPGGPEWEGLLATEGDLLDDLYDREQYIRYMFPDKIPGGAEIRRRVYTGGRNVEQLLVLLWDKDPETGIEPDSRYETLSRRWAAVEEEVQEWTCLPLTDRLGWVPSLSVATDAATATGTFPYPYRGM